MVNVLDTLSVQVACWFYPSIQFEEAAARDDLMGVEDTAKKDILL